MFSAFYALENSIHQSIKLNNFSEALDNIKCFVESVMNSREAPGVLVGSAKLDALCKLVGEKYFSFHQKKLCQNFNFEGDPSNIAIICTGLYKYGGTTLVVNDLIRAHKNFKCRVFLTDTLHDMNGANASLSRVDGRLPDVVVSKAITSQEKLEWLIDEIVNFRPSKIFVLNHHQDSVIISAVQVFIDKTNVLFYHHADYNLCLGVHMEGAIHIDPHNVGFFNCRTNEGISNNFYLPMTVGDEHVSHVGRRFFASGNLTTCASATYHKFGNFYLYSYIEMVIMRLLIRGGRHIHIGNIPEYDKELILQKMRDRGIEEDRFLHIEWVPKLWQALLENDVDLFIASFPIGGARTTIEVMGAGIPILAHENYLSRFYGSRDIIYAEAPVWQYPDEFTDIISSLDQKFLDDQSRKSRAYYEKHYSSENINIDGEIKRICAGRNSMMPPPLYPYNPDILDRMLHFMYLDACARIPFLVRLRRFLLRRVRRLLRPR